MSQSENSPQIEATPESLLPPGDGDETLQRYTYQTICAAHEALLLLDEALELECIFCELHEDILVKKHDGTYHGIQVKTKKAGAFRADYEEITHAIGRFIKTERKFPGIFSGYCLATNTTFEKGQNDRRWQDIDTLIGEAKLSTAANLSDAPALKKWYELYYKDAGDEAEARQVFAKLTLKLQAALEHAELRLASHIGSLPGMDAQGIPALKRLADDLLQLLHKASIRTIDESKIARLNYLPDPQKAYEQAVLDGKRITAGILRTLFDQLVDKGQLPQSKQTDHTSQLAEIKEILFEKFSHLEQFVNGRLPGGATPDLKYGVQIDTLKGLIEEGKPSFALSKLIEVRNQAKAESASEETFFRLAINIGVCYFQSDNLKGAIEEFDKALILKPTSCLALSNKAQVLLSKNDKTAARKTAEKAVEIEINEISGAAYLGALSDLADRVAFDKFVEENPQVQSWPACLSVIAEIAIRTGDYEQGYQTLTEAIKLESRNPQLRTQIAQVLHLRLDKELRTLHDSHLQPSHIDKLQEMLIHLDEAIKIVSKFDNPKPYLRALCNRSFVRSLLDDETGALFDMEVALQIDRSCAEALKTQGMIFFKQKKWKEAISALVAAQSAGASKIELALASCYLAQKQFSKAKDAIIPALDSSSTDVRELVMLDILATAHRSLEEYEEVKNIVSDLRTRWTANADASYMIARQLELDGNVSEAIAFLEAEIATFFDQSAKDLLRCRLAEIYYYSKDFTKAAETFDMITDVSLLNTTVELRITAYSNIGRYDQAHRIAIDLGSNGTVPPIIKDIKATIAVFVGDYDLALKLYEELHRAEPSNIKHLIKAIRLKARKHQFDEAKLELDELSPDTISGDGEALCEIAAIYSYLGDSEKCLNYSYRALKKSPNDPQIQTFFISSFLRVSPDDKKIKTPEKVAAGCCVKIKREPDGPELQFVILPAGQNISASCELSETDSLARLLLDKTVGEQITLKTGTLEEFSYTISELKSEYVAAFQQILLEFPTRFPESKAIETVSVEHEARLMAAVDERHKFGTNIIAAYEAGQLTIAQVAELLEQPRASIFLGLLDSSAKIRAADGSTESQVAELNVAKNAEWLVLDLTGLIAGARLGLLESIASGYKGKILVPTTVLDELLLILHDDAFGARKGMYVGKAGEAYRITEYGDEAAKQRQELIGRIKNFIDNHATLTHSYFGLEDGREKITLERDALGWSTYAAAQIARERVGVICCDDLRSRNYAELTWNVQSLWTRSVLQRLLDGTIISEEQFREAIYKMALFNYWFLPLSAEDLFFALKANDFSINRNVVAVFEKLQDSDVDAGPLVGVLSDLLKQVWLQVLVEERRLWILDLCVKVLTLKHPKTIINLLVSELEKKLWLMPLALNSIKQNIIMISPRSSF
ncbi:MAG: dsDNA nuclease domain-containing protein [Candidatus Melainabacteria bacterium]|nr:dsDNA nuclease domain-containing protein [Candidatus Melainabacteria bacterium]